MNLSAPFVARPIGTTLITLGIALAGIIAFFHLPVSPLPQVDFPTISVRAQLPGASPEDMASSVATPLERHLGQIADVTEMTSSSAVGTTRIVLQFGLDRDIDGAARDVQAAINAARADLPTSLKSNPTYNKMNPADAPIMIMALTSDTLSQGRLYDAATTVLEQKLSQVDGVGEVSVGGSSLPAVRAELQPQSLFKYGIGLEDVRAALAAANANSPKGALETGSRHYQIYTNDQARAASQYRSLVIAYRNGAAVHLSDIAEVDDSVEDLRNQGLANGKPAVLIIIYREPGANTIDVVNRIKGLIPELQASISRDIDITIASDRTVTIQASLEDVEWTLVGSVLLVILVVFVFLRNWRATLIPCVAVPVSLIGTFGVMYLLGYSLDNLSLMALTISTGFVVDDAIVVLENISRHREAGMGQLEATLLGAREVGFTVLSMSLSLIAVFLPILLMGGIVGRLFREFAMTLSVAILISLIISLTTTPMMCAFLVRPHEEHHRQGRFFRTSEAVFDFMLREYDKSLSWVLRHTRFIILVLFGTLALAVYLFTLVPKGFFPQQDTGTLIGGIRADQSISFQLMRQKMIRFVNIVKSDPGVQAIVGFTGGNGTNSGFVFITLKPLDQRDPAQVIMARLHKRFEDVAGASIFLQDMQDIRVGGRQANSQYQFSLQADDTSELYKWTPKLADALRQTPKLTDVDSDLQIGGLETNLVIDRDTASRLGLNASQIDNTLYDAFGQREVSTIYNPLNQYHVVMEVAPQFWQSPESLKDIYVSTSGGSVNGAQSSNAVAGTVSTSTSSSSSSSASTAATVATDTARNQASNSIGTSGKSSASTGSAVSTSVEAMVPIGSFASYGTGNTPLAIAHEGPFVTTTISFNLAPGEALSDATRLINDTMNRIGVPATIHGSFAGTAAVFQSSLANEPILIGAALLAVYVVLGILYESYIHPLTILSTLPSAGVGAILALLVFQSEFDIIALIGVFLLIGIVKKNAIMMIDFALAAERNEGLDSREAIYRACLLRFRPIMMTTLAALLGALPLMLGGGTGSELRRPLGITIVGGLIVSQMLTLYTTPVIYLYLDRLRWWSHRQWQRLRPPAADATPLPAPLPAPGNGHE